MKKLNPRIVAQLARKLVKKPATIRKDIYLLASSHPSSTKNAVAQIYAMKHGKTVFRMLDKEDRQSMPSVTVERAPVRVQEARTRKVKTERIVQFLKLEADESYKRDHVAEINRAYTYHCYTACFVLCRKVIENLVLDVLEIRFPRNAGDNLVMYFDKNQGRYRDFSVLLSALSERSGEFGPDAKLAQRIVALAEPFKKDANDKAHSWYHIVKSPKELDELGVQDIVDLLGELLKKTRSAVPTPAVVAAGERAS
jgi:hypothetical protein